jgi:hypothetical protein
MNKDTQETTWDKPDTGGEDIPPYYGDDTIADGIGFTGKASEWYAVRTDDGDFYYMNKETRETTWDKPAEGEPGKEYEIYAIPHTEVAEDDPDAYDGAAVETDDGESDDEDAIPKKSPPWKVDKTKAIKVVPAAGNLEPMKAPRRILMQRMAAGKWEKKYTASVGGTNDSGDEENRDSREGEAYYINTMTKDTVWDEPEDYVENSSEFHYSGLDFDDEENTTLADGLTLLGFTSGRCKKERERMTVDGRSDSDAFARLQSLDMLMETFGTDQEWADTVSADDFGMVKALCGYLAPKTSADCRLLAMRLMNGCVDFHAGSLKVIMETVGIKNLFMHVEQGLVEGLSVGEDDGSKQDEESERAFCTMAQAVADSFEGDNVMGADDLPSEGCIDALFNVMASASEKTFLLACCATLALNRHYPDHKSNMVMHCCCSNPRAEFFGEALLYELNAQTTPASKPKLQRNAVRCVQDIFSDKTTANFFYTNDLHVLVDIFIREMGDLPVESEMRAEFIKGLSLLLQHSPWFDHGQYRAGDIQDSLKALKDMFDHNDNMAASANDAVGNILMKCGELLEPA